MSELRPHDRSILSFEVSDMVDETFMVSSNLVKYNISLSQIKQRVGILSKLYMIQKGGMNSLAFCATLDSGCARASTTLPINKGLSVQVSKVENVENDMGPQTIGLISPSNLCEASDCDSYSTVADDSVSTIIECDEDSTSDSHHSFYTIAGTSSQNIYDNICCIKATNYHSMSDLGLPTTAVTAGLSSSSATNPNSIVLADSYTSTEVGANNNFQSKNNLSTIKSPGSSAIFDANHNSHEASDFFSYTFGDCEPVETDPSCPDAAYSRSLVGSNISTSIAADLTSPTVAKSSSSNHSSISFFDSSCSKSAAIDKTFVKQDALSTVEWDMLPSDLQERVCACEAALQLQPQASHISDVYARQCAIEERLLALSTTSSIPCSSCHARGYESEGKDVQVYDNMQKDVPFQDDVLPENNKDDFQVEQNDSEEGEEEFEGKDMTLEDIDEEIWMLEAKIKEKELCKAFGNEERE